MKNKLVIIIMGIIILILSVALSVFATLYFTKNSGSNVDNTIENSESDVGKLKEALINEGYTISEDDENIYINQYMKTAYYQYNFTTKEFTYGGNTTFNGYRMITRIYDLEMDIAKQSVSVYEGSDEDGHPTGPLKESYTDQYNFKTGTGECKYECTYLIDFKKEFLELLNKYNIDVDKL